MRVEVSISPGELLDKWTILKIKQEKFTDVVKLENVAKELKLLTAPIAIVNECVPEDKLTEFVNLLDRLQETNTRLWIVEDMIRLAYEERKTQDILDFSFQIIDLNGFRSDIKRKINILLDSDIIEEKEYA